MMAGNLGTIFTVFLRLLTSAQFWLAVLGLALVVWAVSSVLQVEEQRLRHTAIFWGLVLALGAMLTGFLPAATLRESRWWVRWLTGMILRMFVPLLAIWVIVEQRAGQGAEEVAVFTAGFYVLFLWLTLLPLVRKSQQEWIHRPG